MTSREGSAGRRGEGTGGGGLERNEVVLKGLLAIKKLLGISQPQIRDSSLIPTSPPTPPYPPLPSLCERESLRADKGDGEAAMSVCPSV